MAVWEFHMKTITLALVLALAGLAHAGQFAELSTDRVAAVETLLADRPFGFGEPITNRAYWSSPEVLSRTGSAVQAAEKLLKQSFPAWSDDLYLEYSRNGQRTGGEKMQRARSAWLEPLVLAECVENKGRFLPALSTALEGYITEPTWTLPAHDGKLENFHRKTYTVDLRAASFGHDIAEAIYLLGDRLDPSLRQRVVATLYERSLKPVRHSLVTGKGHSWLHADHNWNSVCLAGVVGTALAVEPDRHERAIFAAAGEYYSAHSLKGFPDDGYCAEGGGYWSYGFGNFAYLREELVQATGGKIDLFNNSKVLNIALFGVRFQLNDHLMPPFADCHFGTRADMSLLAYCNEALGLHLTGLANAGRLGAGSLGTALLTPTRRTGGTNTMDLTVGPRSFFADVGVLVCRPSGTNSSMAVAIKSGGNGNHSHNDIGSYIIQVGKDLQFGEPGGPSAYTSQTFGSKRYESKLLNSFGHPVPVIAGKLQKNATRVKPVVLETRFSETEDMIRIDMKPAYDVPELVKLTRTLRFDRRGTGSVTIEDEVEFSTPSSFETAMTTRAAITRESANELRLVEGSGRVTVSVEASDSFTYNEETISEMSAPPYKRLGVKLEKPVVKATIRVSVK
jgi:hypothetical protein